MKKVAFLITTLTVLLLIAGCGGGNDTNVVVHEEETGNEQQLVVKATNFEFDQEVYKVKKGEAVKITFENEQGMHGAGIKGLSIQLDEDKPVIFTANEAGEYELFCNIPCGTGHSGMVAKFIVE